MVAWPASSAGVVVASSPEALDPSPPDPDPLAPAPNPPELDPLGVDASSPEAVSLVSGPVFVAAELHPYCRAAAQAVTTRAARARLRMSLIPKRCGRRLRRGSPKRGAALK